jgi:hypothetical protein
MSKQPKQYTKRKSLYDVGQRQLLPFVISKESIFSSLEQPCRSNCVRDEFTCWATFTLKPALVAAFTRYS